MKIIIKSLILTCLIFTSIGCAQTKSTALEKSNNTDLFFVSPTELTKNDVLKINLPIIRPKNMAIVSPNGQWLTIQNAESGILMMPQEDFMQVSLLTIPIKNTTGFTWINGEETKQVIFKETGKYRIYFADNLETEPENTFNFSAYITVR